MEWHYVQADWQRLKPKVQQQWGHLTDADLNTIAGKREALIVRVQESYRYDRDRAEREVDLFISTL